MRKLNDLKDIVLKVSVFTIGAIALVTGGKAFIDSSIVVNNSVDGRQLPIYCVETEEKKVGLSFDAAWGNDR